MATAYTMVVCVSRLTFLEEYTVKLRVPTVSTMRSGGDASGSSQTPARSGMRSVGLLAIDGVLVFLVGLVVLALLVCVQIVGVATLEVAFASGAQQSILSTTIFTSGVVGGLCGGVVCWMPGMYRALRRMIHARIDRNEDASS